MESFPVDYASAMQWQNHGQQNTSYHPVLSQSRDLILYSNCYRVTNQMHLLQPHRIIKNMPVQYILIRLWVILDPC